MLDDLGKLAEQLVQDCIDISHMLDQTFYRPSFPTKKGLDGR